MTLAEYLRVLRRRWVTVVVFTLLAVVAALSISALMPRSYEATATDFVASTDNGNNSSAYEGSEFALAQVQSYAKLASSPSVLQPVISELDLKTSVAELATRVTATNPAGTVVVQIQARASTAAEAAAIANSVAKHLSTGVAQVNGSGASVQVTTAVPARVPSAPASPRVLLNLALGLVVGLAVGVIVALLRDRFDRSVRSGAHLAAISGHRVLGEVSDADSATGAPGIDGTDEVTRDELSTIRTNLNLLDPDHSPKVMMVSSALAGEGKTQLATRIALDLADARHTVCVVDANLRQPGVASSLEVEQTPGLGNVLAGRSKISDALRPSASPGLSVLPAGVLPSDPSRLLASPEMESLIDHLRTRFDLVVIDTPPLLSVSDAVVVGAHVDAAVLVVRRGHTHVAEVRASVEKLASAAVRCCGVILNRVPRSRSVRRARYHYPTVTSEVARDSGGRPTPVVPASAGAVPPSHQGGAADAAPAERTSPHKPAGSATSGTSAAGVQDRKNSPQKAGAEKKQTGHTLAGRGKSRR